MPPAAALALLLIVLSASAFHALFGSTWRGLLVCLLAALGGYLAGEALARFMDLDLGRVGPLHLAAGLAGAWAAMAIARRWSA